MPRFFPYICVSCFLGGCTPDLEGRLTDQPHLEKGRYIDLNQVPTREEALKPRKIHAREVPEQHGVDRRALESEKKRLEQAQKTIRSKVASDKKQIQ
ncbi:MAG: hypothetical protein ACRCYZ_01130 [Alphaproteobacteria bacterium]